MKVRVSLGGQIVVDGQVDTLDINTTTEDICGDADALVELLEFLVPTDTSICVSKRELVAQEEWEG